MKKILFVIDSLSSGGAEKSLISLLTLFDYNKYEVDLLMFSPTGLYLPLVPNKVNILNVPNFIEEQRYGIKYLFWKKDFKKLFIRLGASISLRNPLNKRNMHSAQINWNWMTKGIDTLKKKYDVAIAYSQGTPTYFVAEKVNSEKKICWINTDYKQAKYNKSYDSKYYAKYDNIVAVSDYNKEVFIKETPFAVEKTKVIYDIVFPNLIRKMAEENGGFEDDFDGLRILTIGRLVDSKGYDLAIEACFKLINRGYNLKWYVIGEGILKSKLENMIKKFNLEDRFIFLGTYNNPYVFLKKCDIYVQPSRFEGYGLALAEARLLLKPIVATNFSIVHNQIKDKENGLIVKMDSESIYLGVKELIENSNLKIHLINNLIKNIVGTERELEKVYFLIEK